MILTAPLFAKSSFLGNILNKCRPAIINAAAENNNKNSVSHFSTTAVAFKTSVEERLGLPPRPKKPLTPYFRYMAEMRPNFVKQNPKASVKEIAQYLSKQWATEQPKVKLRFQEDFKRDQQKYVESAAKYDAKITNEQREEIKQLKQEVSEAKERRIQRKRIKELGRPKRPQSAFLLFLQKERAANPKGSQQNYREYLMKCTEKWSKLNVVEKEAYVEQSRIGMENYKKELNSWEAKMMKAGNMDVVRATNLIDPPPAKPRAKKQ